MNPSVERYPQEYKDVRLRPTLDMDKFESIVRAKILALESSDPSHDHLHIERVVQTARRLCAAERAQPEVVLPAAWLHDLVIIPKDDPRRSKASALSAAAAVEFLREIEYPGEYLDQVAHAVEAHSFSANIKPRSLEAAIVQDADRLDALGAIGIARLLITGGLLNRPIYSAHDPFCRDRAPDDSKFSMDHIYVKLFKISETLLTTEGRREGSRRAGMMREFLDQLRTEIGDRPTSS